MNTNTNNKTSSIIQCIRASDIPREKHWAIIKTQTETKRGYNHGDPDETLTYVSYTAYLDQKEWQLHVIALTEQNHTNYQKTLFTAMEVNPAVIQTSVAVSIV